MCRVVLYSGHSTLLDDLLYKPTNSLVRQTVDSKQLQILNLGGFGLAAWDPASPSASEPLVYRSTSLPLFDRNLKSIAQKTRATCLLAHIRGLPYSTDANFGESNLHPFRYDGYAWAMAHNGQLAGFARMRQELGAHLAPDVARQLVGNSDSEMVYALVMSQLDDPTRDTGTDALVDALVRSLRILRKVRESNGLDTTSSLNLFFANGRDGVALRYAFDFGCYPVEEGASFSAFDTTYLSLWYTLGETYREVDGEWRMSGDPASTRTVIVASEPLSDRVTGWVEVPEYTILKATRTATGTEVETIPVDV